MASVLNERQREALCHRLASLTPSSSAGWGRMDVAAMLAHLCRSARMALGDLAVKSAGKRAFQMFPLKHLFLYVAPFPKNVATAPELLSAQAEPFQGGQAALLELLRRLGAGPTTGAGPVHPFFGKLSRREWGVLMHKHIDHHLRQFGV
jgi:hypothetical protein